MPAKDTSVDIENKKELRCDI